ncbi:MAG: FAD-dependent oxidoreductase [Dehalococcoidales bacterium]|nr:FAD-dependent oxidoreductase [Dehalococcoidales bacterium]
MKKFKHVNADSLEQAASVLGESGGKARIIAGGTDVLGEMQDAILPDYPEVVVNLKTVPGLDYIKEENGSLYIGALTRLEDIAQNEMLKEKYPVLVEASCRTASPHIREMGTLGGNICQSNRCWYYWVPDNRFNCLRKGGANCYALTGDARYHSIFGSTRVSPTPCTTACPAGVDIPSYMDSIREGDVAGAAKTLLEANPIPAVTGRVCPHFCESECNRVDYDEPVSVRCVERYIGDYILEHPEVIGTSATGTGKRVAVIGSGPAGLSAAWYLAKHGHNVTIIEKTEKPGGLLTCGIPAYRLPKDVVDRQIGLLRGMGIQFKLNTEVGKDVQIGELSKDYDAVYLASGTAKERTSGIEGEEHTISGMEFLRKSNMGVREAPGKKVAVVGGGNAAIDVTRTLVRLGAEPVVLYRRSREEMPAFEEEVEHAEEEGVVFQFLTLPVKVTKSDGKLIVTCTRMELGPPDESGRPRPVPVNGSEFTAGFDAVIQALGEEPDASFVPGDFLDGRGYLNVDSATHSVADNIFAGGDFVTGPSTVVEALAAGREAAGSIDRFLGGTTEQSESAEKCDCVSPDRFNSEYLEKTSRVTAPEIPPGERIKSLDAEDAGGLDRSAVETEANRCLNCGCVAVNPSDMAPALIVLGANIKTTRRVIAATDFFTVKGEKTTVLDDDEIVTGVEIPRPAAGTKCKFLKSAIRKSIDFPLVNCAAAVESEKGLVTSARICLNSVYTQPYRVVKAEDYIKGKPIDETTAEAAGDEITSDALPLLNNRYKIQIARTLVKRVLLACGG